MHPKMHLSAGNRAPAKEITSFTVSEIRIN